MADIDEDFQTEIVSFLEESCALASMPADCLAVIDSRWRYSLRLPPVDRDKYYRMIIHCTAYGSDTFNFLSWRAMYLIAKHPQRWPAVAADVTNALENTAEAMHKDVLEGIFDLDAQLARVDARLNDSECGSRLMEVRTVEPGTASANFEGICCASVSPLEACPRSDHHTEGVAIDAVNDAILRQNRELKEACDRARGAAPCVDVAYWAELFAHPAVQRRLASCVRYVTDSLILEVTLVVNASARDETCRLPAWLVLHVQKARPGLSSPVWQRCIKRMIEAYAERLEAPISLTESQKRTA